MDAHEERGLPAYPLTIATTAATPAAMFLAAGGIAYSWLWLIAGIIVLLFVIGSLVTRSMHPAVLSRRWGRNPLRPWEKNLLLPALLLYPVTAAVGAGDMAHGGSALPSWVVIAGFFLIVAGYVLIIQAFQADAPHALEHYGESPRENGDRGAYDILRHPVALGAMMIGLSLPLLLYSAFALIPAGLQAAVLIGYVVREDDWRFHEYEWYYEYTRKTPYRMFPFIW
jgi:protein-S-isoprenylcysteine O-methyltransferase Ste14